MIGRIQGQLLEISETLMLIDVGGVAYEIEGSTAALAITAPGADIALFTHLIVREDAQLLYGFGSRTERDVFRDLIRINGVGPKLALSIVSALTLEALADAVRSGDASLLTRVPGVGKKTAERLLVDLKDRLSNLHLMVQPVSDSRRADPSAAREAEDALVALGYRPAEAQRAVDAVSGAALTSEELLRAALRQIARSVETTTS